MTRADRRLIIVSGPLCAGKTTLAVGLGATLPAEVLSARQVLLQLADDATREDLQRLGSQLEQDTKGTWLAAAAAKVCADNVVVDSARTLAQASALRRAAVVAPLILLEASEGERKLRFQARSDPIDSSADVDAIFVRDLPFDHNFRRQADLVLDTERLSEEEVQEKALKFLKSCL